MNTIEIIGIVIGAIASILGGMWFIINKATKSGIKEHRLSSVESSISQLPCHDHKDKLSQNEMAYKEIQKTAESTNNMLTELSKWAMRLDSDMIDKLAKKSSPLKMTEVGAFLFEKSTAKEAIDNNKEFLIDEIRKATPKTEYDIEEKALDFLLKNMGHEMFDSVKNFIYYSPDTIIFDKTGEEIKFNMQSIIKLMSIYLRDVYIENTKG